MAEPGNHRRRRIRVERGRRTWSREEDDTLLTYLKELVVAGWRSDNGFRAGYVNKLEDMMHAHFPRSNIRATPHIASKLTRWKKNYGTLVYILSRSGGGFNVHSDFTVDCEKEQWDQIINVDANAKNIRGKSWPYFDRWIEIFGKDRATGETAEDVFEAVNRLIIDDQFNVPEDVVGDNNADYNMDVPATPDSFYSASQSLRGEPSCSKSSRKRKACDEMDLKLCEMLGQMQQDTNSRLETISHRIGYQSDLGAARKEIFRMLATVQSMSLDERFDVADGLLDCPSKLEFFTSLPAEARSPYACRLLLGKGV